MKTVGRTQSPNIGGPDMMSPDDRDIFNGEQQDLQDKQLLDAMRHKASDVPLPRSRIDPGFLKELNDQVDANWVEEHKNDFGAQKNGNFLGITLWRHENPEAAQFLLDTFKRARSVGYPIGPLLPILHGYPSSTFGDATVEPFDPNQENN